jgi:ribonuclease HI
MTDGFDAVFGTIEIETPELTDLSPIEIYTDGACKPNPGRGGWAAILLETVDHQVERREISGAEHKTTSNRMEIYAAIRALEALTGSRRITIYTDSRYLREGITWWINNWKRNGWINSYGDPIKNMDLWKRLDQLIEKHHVSWQWIKGHNGNTENERCDELARQARYR